MPGCGAYIGATGERQATADGRMRPILIANYDDFTKLNPV